MNHCFPLQMVFWMLGLLLVLPSLMLKLAPGGGESKGRECWMLYSREEREVCLREHTLVQCPKQRCRRPGGLFCALQGILRAPACLWTTPAVTSNPRSRPGGRARDRESEGGPSGTKSKAARPVTCTLASHSPHPCLHPAREELEQLIVDLAAIGVSFLPSLFSGKWALLYVDSPNDLNDKPKISTNSRNS